VIEAPQGGQVKRSNIGLGDTARDTITGFTGVVICEAKWLHGCRRLTLQPRELKDGKPVEMQTFDEPQLAKIAAPPSATTGHTGGPRPEPTRAGDPQRP